MANTIRSFIAIKLSEDIRSVLKDIQDQLKAINCSIKWIEPKNLHLTLKFIGNIEINKLNAVKEIMKMIPSNNTLIQLDSIKVFPNIKKPRIIWVGVTEKTPMLINIANYLNETLSTIGIPKEEKAFTPHITIGRVKTSKNLHELIKCMEQISIPKETKQMVTNITLFKSTLTPTGPIYEEIYVRDL